MWFVLSAPGLISLCGGPTMRRKQQYVSASLDMRTTLSFALLPAGTTNFIEIEFSSIKLNVRIPLRIFNAYFSGDSSSELTDFQLCDKIKSFVNSTWNYKDTDEFINDSQLYLESFFYLLVLISYQRKIRVTQSFSVKVSTEVPMGLGFSASITVCLAACFWRWSQKGCIRNQFGHNDLQNIAKYAKSCSDIINNSYNQINIITSTYGGIYIFDEQTPTDHFPEMPNMRILLVFSNQKTNINQNMQMKMIRFLRFSTYINPILESIDSISIKFIQTLKKISHAEARLLNNGNAENQTSLINNYQILLDLVHINQGLLKALGMSNPNLDIICAIARDFSLTGKIASKSASEYAFILVPPNITDEVIDCLLKKLELHNFTTKITRVCCSGLIIE